MSESRRSSACPCCHSSPAKLLSAKQANSRLKQPQTTLATQQSRCEELRGLLLDALNHQVCDTSASCLPQCPIWTQQQHIVGLSDAQMISDCGKIICNKWAVQESLRALFQRAHAAEEKLRQQSLRSTKAIDNINSTRAKLSAAQARVQGVKTKLIQLPQQVTQLKQTKAAVLRELSNRRKAHELAAQSLAIRQAMEVNALLHVLPVRISGVKANTRQPMQVRLAHHSYPLKTYLLPVTLISGVNGTGNSHGYAKLWFSGEHLPYAATRSCIQGACTDAS